MKRRLLQLCVFLMLGAIVTVAVAWGCVAINLTTAQFVSGPTGDADNAWFATVTERPGALSIWSAVGVVQMGDTQPYYTPAPDVLVRVPRWSRVHGPLPDVDAYIASFAHYEDEDARGWPMLAMRSGFSRMSFGFKDECRKGRVPGAIVGDDFALVPMSDGTVKRIPLAPGNCVERGYLLVEPRGATHDYRILPLHPIWPGFAIDTLFYAAILWGLFAAPFAMRRRRRIKRGLCPKCAYPVGTSAVCTECGQALPQRGREE